MRRYVTPLKFVETYHVVMRAMRNYDGLRYFSQWNLPPKSNTVEAPGTRQRARGLTPLQRKTAGSFTWAYLGAGVSRLQ